MSARLSCLLAGVLLFSGSRKVAGGKAVNAEATHLGVPVRGSGAVITHIRVGDAPGRWAPAATLAVLAVVGLLLRVASA